MGPTTSIFLVTEFYRKDGGSTFPLTACTI